MTETKNLAEALAMLMMKLPRIEKANKAEVETKSGRPYSYTYADLAQVSRMILPILGELGLSFTAKPTMSGDRFVLAYRLLHVGGQEDTGEYPLPTGGTPQATGAAITYARRYSLCAVTGVAPEDDDDGAAAQAEHERHQESRGRSAWRGPDANQTPASGDSKASKPQLQLMANLFNQVEWTDKGDRLRAASKLVGRELSSATELTRDEASSVIDVLREVAAGPDPAVKLGELISAEEMAGDRDE